MQRIGQLIQMALTRGIVSTNEAERLLNLVESGGLGDQLNALAELEAISASRRETILSN